MLPTLGLTKYTNIDLAVDKTNPYQVQAVTEKLLICKEREREFGNFNKLEKEGQRVHEKETGAKPNRTGVIRSIRDIKATSSMGNLGKNRGVSQSIDNEDKRMKLNVFDNYDTHVLNREKLNHQ